MITILINALGIVDSGGIAVLDKALAECATNKSNAFFIVCNGNENIRKLKIKYKEFNFIVVRSGLLYRVFYENIIFRRLVIKNNIQLIYNFSGSAQLNFFIHIPQLTKVHNLLFYSRNLDSVYYSKKAYFEWFKQVFLKRLYFKFMLNQSKYIEVQSSHVQDCLSNFINANNKIFYEKSDIDVSSEAFTSPRRYDFSKKIKFLYIVGPHFEYMHKNFIDFVNALIYLDKKGVDFEINITLTSEQLNNSKIWDVSLNSKTNYLGYISDQEKMTEFFCDNTILISTSIIETLGLHVIEGIKNGVITIAPDEKYANVVYGDNMFKYDLFNKDSLFDTIMTVINYKGSYSDKILSIQHNLRCNEMSKLSSILEVFDKVVNVQK